MDRHVNPPRSGAPAVPEPTYAERARTLVYVGRVGTLSTLSLKHPGYPFGSVMPYSLDGGGCPLFLISTMAMHSQNLQADRRASLLVIQPGWAGDALAAARVTLVGEVRPLARAGGQAARQAYLARHPNAIHWVDFEDFGFHCLDVADVYFVGGFAAMGWVPAEEYLAAQPDPLADVAAEIIEHMNRDHPDALTTFARVLADAPADEALMLAVDRLGFKLRIKHGQRLSSARIAFPREITTAEACRAAFIEMLKEARSKASA